MSRLSVRRRQMPMACLLLLFTLMHPLPLKAEEQPPAPAGETALTTATNERGEEGIASYYAKRYNGRRTTSGKRYRPDGMTAAHPSLPLGTKIRVTNLANDREVVVTINDRCRKKKTPFVDLSRAAAKKLGFLGRGTARVRIVPLEADSST